MEQPQTQIDFGGSRTEIAGSRSGKLPYSFPPLPRTVRFYGSSLLLALGAIVLCIPLLLLERSLVGREGRDLFFAHPLLLPNQLLGFPHFLIAAFFLMTSARFRSPSTRGWFAGLLGLGVLLAVAFFRLGGPASPTAIFAVAAYFTLHEFRDQAFFCRVHREAPAGEPERHALALRRVQMIFLSGFIGFGFPSILLGMELRGRRALDPRVFEFLFPPALPLPIKIAIYAVPAVVLIAVLGTRLARDYPGGLRAMMRDHRPVLLVYLIYTALLLSISVVNGIFSLLVLAHFVAWYRFSFRRLQQAPSTSSGGILDRVRSTPGGFRALYFGMAGVVVLLMVLSNYGPSGPNGLGLLVGRDSFYALTIVHITLSFAPR